MNAQDAMMAEYKMLRDDIQQRIRFRFQIFTLLFTVLSAFLALGFQQGNPDIFLGYPIVSFFLAMNWIHQSVVMVKLSRYILEEIEPKVEGLNWEVHINKASEHFAAFSIIGFLASSGFIIFSQVLSILLATLKDYKSEPSDFMLILATIGFMLSLIMLLAYRYMKR